MVTINSNDVAVGEKRPLFIYITGCDGTGKSTQAELLLQQLEAVGATPRHLWLRFPFLFSLPLLAYARWRGMSWYEDTGSVRHGYWDFRDSLLMRWVFPWVLLLDASLAALRKVYLPLWRGEDIVCERFVLDMLVDMALAFDDESLHQQLPGRLYQRLLPNETQIILLDLDAPTIRERRADMVFDRRLDARLSAFRRIAADYDLQMLSNTLPVADIGSDIWKRIGTHYECRKNI